MDRRLFLGSILGLALQSTAARAQSQQPGIVFDPHPAFVHVKMIVVGYMTIMSEDLSLLARLDGKSLGAEVTEFIGSRFDAAGHPVVCVDQRQLRDLPEGQSEADLFRVTFRIDLSSARVADDATAVVGTVSTQSQRGEFRLLSWVPMTHFVVEADRSALAERAKQALFEQAQRSVVDMLVELKKHGF
jgi:hypothetical protein